MEQKYQKKFFIFEIIAFESRCSKFSVLPREFLSWAVNVLTNSPKAWYNTNRDIFQLKITQNDEKIWKNCFHSAKCKFQKCLGSFTMLNVEECSETGLFRHLSNQVFCIL